MKTPNPQTVSRRPFLVWAIRGLLILLLGMMPIFYSTAQQSSVVAFAPFAPNFEGVHETATCSAVTGWAWDSMQPNTPINVDIFVDEVLQATVTADQFRQDLLNSGRGNGNHGFSFAVPGSLLDGQPHSIRVKFANSSLNLFKTPRMINCTPFAFQGVHEAAN